MSFASRIFVFPPWAGAAKKFEFARIFDDLFAVFAIGLPQFFGFL
jgi:hypothetical protein